MSGENWDEFIKVREAGIKVYQQEILAAIRMDDYPDHVYPCVQTEWGVRQLMELQQKAYPKALLEDENVFVEIIRQGVSYAMDVCDQGHVYTRAYLLCQYGDAVDELNAMPDPNADKGHLFIRDLVVEKRHQGKGYAKQLLQIITDPEAVRKKIDPPTKNYYENEILQSLKTYKSVQIICIPSALLFWEHLFKLEKVREVAHGTVYNLLKKY